MKKIASLAVLLMLVAGSAMAAGLNLAWDDCLGAGGLSTKTVTCTNSATAVQKAFVSFVSPSAIANNGATDVNVDVQAPNTMSTWWLNYGARYAATTGPSTCGGWYDAAPNGGVLIGPNATQTSPSRTRLRVVIAVATGQEQPIDNVTEMFNNTIDLKFGAGTFLNAECTAGAAFAATRLDLQQPGGGSVVITGADTDNCSLFRAGGGSATCPGATPTTKTTWGSIKAIYR